MFRKIIIAADRFLFVPNHCNRIHNVLSPYVRLFRVHSSRHNKLGVCTFHTRIRPILSHRPLNSSMKPECQYLNFAIRQYSTQPPDKDDPTDGNICIDYEEKRPAFETDARIENMNCAKSLEGSDLLDRTNLISMNASNEINNPINYLILRCGHSFCSCNHLQAHTKCIRERFK